MLMGEFHHNIDEKGRLVIPTKYRMELGETFVIARGLEKCLYVYPMEKWNKLVGKLDELPFTRKDARTFTRTFFSGATACEFDNNGRINITSPLVSYAGLVHTLSPGVFPGTPLGAVNRPQVPVLIRPFVPNAHPVLLEVTDVGVPGDEPQQFIDDGLEVHLLGRQQRETIGKVAAQLVAEHAARARSCAVFLVNAVLHHVAHQVKILFHFGF